MDIAKEIGAKGFANEYHRATVNVVFSAHWLTKILEQRASEENITLHQFNVLRILRGIHPQACTNNQIQERMVEKNSDVSRIVNRLVTKGLIRRERNERDGRAVALTITSLGLETLDKLDQPMLLNDLLPNRLSIEECVQLNELLNKMRG